MADEQDDVTVEADGSEELGKGGTDAAAKVTKLKKELEQVKKEKQEYLDGWQRAKADYVNALKRFEEEKRMGIELGKMLSIGAFLPVIDSLLRAEAVG
ncbi:nucleotide exchange factor GrpE, partial [Candidatus Parcubacteria bacterium]|nr:nucleotide exchange factor GrpE [Candidatus Parcubacteria bacterium]